MRFELDVQVCVQGKYYTLTHLNYNHKIIDENIPPALAKVDEIVDKMQQRKYGIKPQHDLHSTKKVKVYFCLFITRAVNGHLH
jgi:hypothetical protein